MQQQVPFVPEAGAAQQNGNADFLIAPALRPLKKRQLRLLRTLVFFGRRCRIVKVPWSPSRALLYCLGDLLYNPVANALYVHFQPHYGGTLRSVNIRPVCVYAPVFKKHVVLFELRTPIRGINCEGLAAEPVVTPNVGILSSTDILALDQACVDLIYAMTEAEHHDLVERMETRHGLRQLSYMKELGMGNDRYVLIDLDNGGKRITPAEAVQGLKPFVQETGQ